MDGWIKLHRCLLEKAVWQLNDAQRIVFFTILLLANHKGRQWLWKGTQFNAEPGQFVTSLPRLAKTARVSVQSVRTALDNLKKLDFLTYQSTGTGRLVTVNNWAFYQRNENESTDESTDDQQTTNRRPTATKNDNNVKEKSIARFTEFWTEYPNKVSKQDCIKLWGKIKPEEHDAVIEGARRYKDSKKVKEGFVMGPDKWLRGRRWEDNMDDVSSVPGKTMTKAQADAMDKYEYIKLMQAGWQVIT